MSDIPTIIKRKLRERKEQRQSILTQLEHLDAVSPEEQNRIVNLTALEVVCEMKSGKTSAENVMSCMILQAMRAGIDLKSNAEELFESSLLKARRADELRQEVLNRGEDPETVLPPLHGLPLSVKDCIDQKGQVSTCGMASRAFDVMEEDASIVSTLVAAGAIPFVRSNVPQLLMIPESYNLLWGKTCNPWKLDRTPGGSSGGEGALVAARGSFLGLGTDIGGSVRIPANFCGVFGFKPTSIRVAPHGCSSPRKGRVSGQPLIRGVAGPLARSADDLEMVMQLWFNKDAHLYKKDPYTPPVYWRNFSSPPFPSPSKKIRVGYFYSDGFIGSADSYRRAVDEAKAGLKNKFSDQYEFVPFQVPDPEEFAAVYIAVLNSDGKMRAAREDLRGESLADSYKTQYSYSKIPNFMRPMIAWLLNMLGEERKAGLIKEMGSRTTYEYWQVSKRVKMYRKKFLNAMKAQGDIDVLLVPGHTLPAFPHYKSTDILFSCSVTFLFNLLDFPAGTVPITVINSTEETKFTEIKNDSMSKDMRATLIGSVGLPLGVQIAARPFQDELVLKVMCDLESAIDFRGKHKPDIAKKPISVEALRSKL